MATNADCGSPYAAPLAVPLAWECPGGSVTGVSPAKPGLSRGLSLTNQQTYGAQI
jgi:hypothetical protein